MHRGARGCKVRLFLKKRYPIYHLWAFYQFMLLATRRPDLDRGVTNSGPSSANIVRQLCRKKEKKKYILITSIEFPSNEKSMCCEHLGTTRWETVAELSVTYDFRLLWLGLATNTLTMRLPPICAFPPCTLSWKEKIQSAEDVSFPLPWHVFLPWIVVSHFLFV